MKQKFIKSINLLALLSIFLAGEVTAQNVRQNNSAIQSMVVGRSRQYTTYYLPANADDKVELKQVRQINKKSVAGLFSRLALAVSPTLLLKTAEPKGGDQQPATTSSTFIPFNAGVVLVPELLKAKTASRVTGSPEIAALNHGDDLLYSKTLARNRKAAFSMPRSGKLALKVNAGTNVKLSINNTQFILDAPVAFAKGTGEEQPDDGGVVTQSACIEWYLITYINGVAVSEEFVGYTCDGEGYGKSDGGWSAGNGRGDNNRNCPKYNQCVAGYTAIRNNTIESADATFLLATAACLGAGTAAYSKVAALTTGPSMIFGPAGIGGTQTASVIAGILVAGGCEALNATIWDNTRKNARLQCDRDIAANCTCK